MPAHSGDPVTAALRQSLLESAPRESLDEKLSVSSTRVLLGHINYEPAGSFESTVLGNLKNKYIVLKNDLQSKKNVAMMSASASSSSDGKKEADSSLPTPKVVLYPSEKVRPGWAGTYPIGAGMINVGNTCYLNSTLQALFHVPSLVNWLESDSDHLNSCFTSNGSIENECIICAMNKTLKMSHSKSGGVMKPYFIYNKLKLICKHMVHGQQEDAHEFLRYLMESMEKAYLARHKNIKLDNYSKETTPLNQIFGGYIRTEVKCLQCHGVSTTFQHFQDLLLDIRRSSALDDALSAYFCKEPLDGDDAYRCERCHKKVSATKKFSIERPPTVLCIQLKRFSIMGGKINKHVTFSQKLDLTKFLCPQSTHVSQKPLVYKLVAMVTHVGSSVHCGHYTAVAQTSTGQFYHFDDSSVRPISLHSALETNAYIIMYEIERAPCRPLYVNPGSSSKPATVTSSALSTHSGSNSKNVFKTDSLRQSVPSVVESNTKIGTTTFPACNGSIRSPTQSTPARGSGFPSTSSNPIGSPVDRKMGLLPPVKDRGRVTFGLRPQLTTPVKNGKVCQPPTSLVPYESDDSSSGDSGSESAKNKQRPPAPNSKCESIPSFPFIKKKELKNKAFEACNKKELKIDIPSSSSSFLDCDSWSRVKDNSDKVRNSEKSEVNSRTCLRVNTAPSPARGKATSAGWQVTEVSLHSPSVNSGSSNTSGASSTTEWAVSSQKRKNTTSRKKKGKSSTEELRKTTSEDEENPKLILNGTKCSPKYILPEGDRNSKITSGGAKHITKLFLSDDQKEVDDDEDALKVSSLPPKSVEKKLDLDFTLDVAVVSTDEQSEEKKEKHRGYVNGKNFHPDAVNGNEQASSNADHHWGSSCRPDVADRLHNNSYGPYGSNVNTWNGTHAHPDRKLEDGYENNYKRKLDDLYDEELDRGRVKKMKYNNDRNPDNRPKFNAFQEYQQKNNMKNGYQNGNLNFFRRNRPYYNNKYKNNRDRKYPMFRYHRGGGYKYNRGSSSAVSSGSRYGAW